MKVLATIFIVSAALLSLNGCSEGEPQAGDVAFWSDRADFGNMEVHINGTYKGEITRVFDEGQPTCWDAKTVTVTLPYGEHSYKVVFEDSTESIGSFRLGAECLAIKLQ